MKRLKQLFCLLAALLFACMPAMPVNAAGGIVTGKETSLTLNYKYGGVLLPGVTMKIYRVAQVSPSALFTLIDGWQTAGLDINDVESSDQWLVAAKELANNIPSEPTVFSGTSNQQGRVSFNSLNTGLYLVVSNRLTLGNYNYSFSPFLISLPNLDAHGDWVYDINATPKSQRSAITGPSTVFINYQVVKRWVDSGFEEKRPRNVTVEIRKDGIVYVTRVLSENNNWTFHWSAVADGSDWQVFERNTDQSYSSAVTESGTTFVVTNTYTDPDKPDTPGEPDKPDTPGDPDKPDTPGEPDKPDTPGDPDKPDTPGNPDKPDTPGDPDKPDTPGDPDKPGTQPGGDDDSGAIMPPGPGTPSTLPQTGQLWWPVPLLGAAGLILFVLGWKMRAGRAGNSE